MAIIFRFIFIFLAGVIVGFYLNLQAGHFFAAYKQLSISSEYPPDMRSSLLAKMIEDDFLELAELGKLPPEWSQVSKVDFKNFSSFAGLLLGHSRPLFNINRKGLNFLEIDFIDVYDNQNPCLILQASLFDRYSKNKIFEIGRTYSLRQFVNEQRHNREVIRALEAKPRR